MLVLVLIILITFQIIQAITVLNIQDVATLSLTFDANLQVAINGIWVILFTFGLIKLARSDEGTVRYIQWSLLGFMVYSIIRLVLLTQADYDRQRLALIIIGGLLLIIALGGSIYHNKRHPSS